MTTVPYRITLTVSSVDPNLVVTASEMMGRAAAGLALEGVEAALLMGPDKDDEE